jgi:hypothetical protein
MKNQRYRVAEFTYRPGRRSRSHFFHAKAPRRKGIREIRGTEDRRRTVAAAERRPVCRTKSQIHSKLQRSGLFDLFHAKTQRCGGIGEIRYRENMGIRYRGNKGKIGEADVMIS